MKLTRLMWFAAVFLSVTSVDATESESGPLRDPIPERIVKGNVVVAATEFVRAPRTADSSTVGANDAYARIQYLLPIRDGSGRLMFNDLRGLLYLTDVNGQAPGVYMDLRTQDIGFDDSMFPNETGLSGFAFHPEFSAQGRPGYGKFYTSYSTSSDNGTADYLDDDAASHESVIREWTTNTPGARTFQGSSREVFRIGQFSPNHNIGTISFNPYAQAGSPDYGLLFFSLGDGGGAFDPRDYGQSLAVPQAAILRIDPLKGNARKGYGIPPDNPFLHDARAAPEIWAYGLRHAQQFSWDADGRMFIGDIGQNQVEEINLGVAGANYGWRLREGTFATSFAVQSHETGPVFARPAKDKDKFVYPVAQYDHDEGNAVSGGFVYRGNSIPELQGKYVFTDLARGRVFFINVQALRSGNPVEIKELRIRFDGREQDLSSVAGYPNTYAPGKRVDLRLGIDAAGELYLLTKGDGWIRKLVPAEAR
ncbi:MAG: PQQ-dependent sugar dehydrogenase [Pseudomonadales bacterium]|nr:PQQ-dependent sugar dehydrogenase [Pseudomonadales bacterium]MDP7597300.1 PQQ-dependent sugar dehydrogenase [Pseudomonadales bacterium]HJN49791.1 PQQ-dependent sugar dehydrogenase [Pseudomonadales bacterium]